jgi:Ca2+-binding EF-hand superfamily protein
VFSPLIRKVFDEIFERLDLDYDGALSKREMDAYAMATEGCTMGQAAFEWMLRKFESTAAGLTLAGFQQSQVFAFKSQVCMALLYVSMGWFL